MATPFIGEKFKFTQPDGSKLEVRGWGNQYAARFETLDGYTVTKDPATGFWEIAQVSDDGQRLESVPGARAAADGGRSRVRAGLRLAPAAMRAAAHEGPVRPGETRWEERRRERKQALSARTLAAPGAAARLPATVGDYYGLCLLVDFSDAPASPILSQAEVERFCNQHNYAGFGNNGSVYDYFFDNSLGRVKYKSIVTPYYRAIHPKTYYTDPSVPFGQRARELIEETLQHWISVHFDVSKLTADSAGKVYATNVFYAGDRTNDFREGLWPHSWSLAAPVTLTPGKAAFDYQITEIGSELSLGTFCHENGHMLCDYPDLYDYDDAPSASGGVGSFCLMCLGGNRNPKNPGNISGYLKRLSGWASSVTDLEPGKRVSLCASKNEFAIHSKSPTEYFLLEHRTQTGRDASLPDAGLAIWHVDETGNNSWEMMTPAQHYELSLEQADGLFELERNLDAWGDGEDLFARRGKFGDATTPDSKWWDGSSSHLTIDRISIGRTSAVFRSSFAARHVAAPSVSAEATGAQAGADGE